MTKELRVLLLASLGLSAACVPTIAEIFPERERIEPDPDPIENDYGDCDPLEVEGLDVLEDGDTPPEPWGRYVRCEDSLSYAACMDECGDGCQEDIADAQDLDVDEWTSAYVSCGTMWLDERCCVQIYLDPGWDEGRPFLVEGEARLAESTRTSAWSCTEAEPIRPEDARPVSAEIRGALVARWTRTGLQEHASVAAFSRFSLVLLHLGAPVDLVRDTHVAALDEVRHAQLCFGLASAYASEAIGPGELPVDDALVGELDPEQVLRTLYLEGCVGETTAALRARTASAAAEDPVVSAVLDQIARDEARHAALAWRAIRWLLEARPALRTVLSELLDAPAPQGVSPDPEGLEAHGVLGDARCAELSLEAYARVVRPVGHALLASPPASGLSA